MADEKDKAKEASTRSGSNIQIKSETRYVPTEADENREDGKDQSSSEAPDSTAEKSSQ